MESRSRTETPDPAAARAALDSVTAVRARTAEHITSPWWYHFGLGTVLAVAFLSISMRWASYGVPMALLAGLLLGTALKRSTGLSLDRYAATPGARKLSMAHGLTALAVTAIAMYLEWGAKVYGAVAVAGLLIGALTVAVGYRIDAALRADLRASHERPGL
ncbi:hypothetical protein [Nonomuraea jiangxiensis]|uniref:Uncharacterized protein n=1 Tax=Nonomuraea jiangxiensis TaxID=633440 RepID=A0A1G8CNX1_9ACTN|nr:hypothetical protein [Nonomuraea jiangxiensis]SDH46560.1 hypothetical protein SAMN05421869_102336 [Nonomuraea jiangxiensis]